MQMTSSQSMLQKAGGRMRRLLALPVSILCLASIGLSAFYVWNIVAQPPELQLSGGTSTKVFVASGSLLISTFISWRLVGVRRERRQGPLLRWIGAVLGVLPSCYYLPSIVMLDALDVSLGVLAIATIATQIFLWSYSSGRASEGELNG